MDSSPLTYHVELWGRFGSEVTQPLPWGVILRFKTTVHSISSLPPVFTLTNTQAHWRDRSETRLMPTARPYMGWVDTLVLAVYKIICIL